MKFLTNYFTNILMNFDFSEDFSLTYYLLTVASFRIGVPSILFFQKLTTIFLFFLGLYAHKYEEEFSPYMKPFVMSVWNLLLSLGPQKKYDMLTSNAIQFLASVADRAQYKSLFEEESTLASICEKIIVPNIEMRECDVELFEDTPEQYVTQDLEGNF